MLSKPNNQLIFPLSSDQRNLSPTSKERPKIQNNSKTKNYGWKNKTNKKRHIVKTGTDKFDPHTQWEKT